jgi:hypothetical protein
MRVIGEIPNSACKITLFHWNNRYLVKLEKGYLEQTFKIDQFELASEKDLTTLVNTSFIQQAVDRFDAMEQSLSEALQSL